MKIKNIMNTYYGMRKESLERNLDKIEEQYDESLEQDITITEAFLGGGIEGLRKGIWINGVVVTVTAVATCILTSTGHTVDKKSK